MSDSKVELITANLKSVLASLSTYGGKVAAVERERFILNINGRYPYVQLCGPVCEIESQTYKVGMNRIYYETRYFINVNDEGVAANTEITYLTRNVASDIIKQVQTDTTQDDNALITKATDFGYDFYIDDNSAEFFIYVDFEITARIDTSDPYLNA